MKTIFAGFCATIVLAAAVFAFDLFRFANTGTGSANDTVVFELPSGLPMAKVAARLKQQSLITSEIRFRLLAKMTSQAKRMKKGEYLLNRSMSPQDIFEVLASGRSIQYPVTFPEGSNIYDMAQILEGKGFFKSKEFLTLVKNRAFVQQTLGFSAPSLEGYLFPETYNVTKLTTLKELIHSMVQRFNENYKALESKATVHWPKHQIVTMASVIEKETGAPEERPMIASVFYNRLQKGIPLQSDPTILYGIIDETGRPTMNITKADISHPNRYNTYTVKGLPFGPIANPGKESLAATLAPPVTEYLYFVSRNNGTSIFTKTYAEHLQAVRKFQLDPAAREGHSWRELQNHGNSAAK